MDIRERLYVFYRQIKAAWAYFTAWVMAVRYPIQANKVVFCSTEGMGGYGDNPKAIAEYLHAHHPKLELVWLVNDMTKKFPPYIRKAPNTVISRSYEYATAKIWVDCHRKPYGTRKRKGQYYLQTWHGPIGFKPIGARRGKKLPKMAELVSRADSKLIDAFISNSEWNTQNVLSSLYYDGPMVKWGSPRCDIFFDQERRQEVRQGIYARYHIPLETKVLLYAPTFRAGSQRTRRIVDVEQASLNFDRVLDALEAKTGGQWLLMLRLHPQAAARFQAYPDIECATSRYVDVSQYPDTYEILASVDLALTDYSSLAFDASYARLPVLLYADDLQEMKSDRGGLLWEMEDLPYPFAATEKQLIQNIASFDMRAYIKDLDEFFVAVGLLEDGQASKRAAQWIEEKCNS